MTLELPVIARVAAALVVALLISPGWAGWPFFWAFFSVR